MKDVNQLQSEGHLEESGEDYSTHINIATIGVVIAPEGDRTGLLVEPMDAAPYVIEIGSPDQLKALGNYLMEVADELE